MTSRICAQGYKLDAQGACICDPTTAGVGCTYCVVPGSCGSPLPGKDNGQACAEFAHPKSYGPAFRFMRDALTGLGRCECNPAFELHCASCIFPGLCRFCNAPFELLDGKCGTRSAPLST